MAARPDAFLLFLIIIPVLIVFAARYRRGMKDLNSIGGKWRSHLLLDVFLIKWFFSSLVFILFIVFSVLAVAGFTRRGNSVIETSTGIDIVFAVDISGSMLCEDIYPSRLKRSSDMIKAFVENLPGGRFGLVVFKGKGTKIIPVTEDTSAVSNVLPFLGPDMFSSTGSDLENGISSALDAFVFGEERKKIILVFTDGESLSGNPMAAARKAEDLNIDIIIFGAGTEEGSEVIGRNGEPQLNDRGEVIISRLNITQLSRLDSLDNFLFFNLSDPMVLSDSLEIIDQWLYSSVTFDQVEERYRFFLSAAILFLFLYVIVRIFKWKNTF